MNVKTVINAHNFDADQKLLDFIQTKINKLGVFYDGIVEAVVYLRVENNQEMENKTAEVRLLIPGDDIFVKKTALLRSCAIFAVPPSAIVKLCGALPSRVTFTSRPLPLRWTFREFGRCTTG